MRVLERGNPAPFSLRRGRVGCLLLHGFPGAPAEMRPLGEYLAARDVTVEAPLLPGMGTVPEDLFRVTWRDWVDAAGAALEGLRQQCDEILVCGLSMGGALSLYLATQYPVAGVAALAPAIRPRDRRMALAGLLRPFMPWVGPSKAPDDLSDPAARALTWHYLRYPTAAVPQVRGLIMATRRALPLVRCPVLVIQSPRDGALDPAGAQWAYDHVSSADKAIVWLERSGHNIAVDVERERVFGLVYHFIDRLARMRP